MKARRSNTHAAARAVSRRKKAVPQEPPPRTYVDRVCDLIRRGMS